MVLIRGVNSQFSENRGHTGTWGKENVMGNPKPQLHHDILPPFLRLDSQGRTNQGQSDRDA